MNTRPVVRFLDRTTPPHIVTLVLLSGIAAMNMSAFLPSLPRMTEHFQTSFGVMQISVSGYLALTAIVQLMVGPLSDRYGRRNVVIAAMSIFTVASMACATADSIEVFMFFRLMQGAVATGIVLSRAVVRDMVPQDQAASMIGYVTMGMALVPMFAPMIGGALDQAFGWRSVFWALTATGAVITLLSWADQGETVSGDGVSFSQQLKDYPELLSSQRFWGYVLTTAFASGAFFAFLGGGPFVASTVFGLSPFWVGVCFGIPAIGYATGNYLTGRYAVRFGVNRLVFMGSLIGAVGLSFAVVLTLIVGENVFLFFSFCTIIGLGNGLVIPNASAGMLSVRPHLAGTASGLGSATMIAGGAALSVLGGASLSWGSGGLPLLIIMASTMCFSLMSISFVLLREKKLQSQN